MKKVLTYLTYTASILISIIVGFLMGILVLTSFGTEAIHEIGEMLGLAR